jgi:hypothetical protein
MTVVFCALASQVESHGVRVDLCWCDKEEQRGGDFHPTRWRKPSIVITRPRGEQRLVNGGFEWVPEFNEEREAAFTLAHEFGHFLSWRSDPEAWKTVHMAMVKRHTAMATERPMRELVSREESIVIIEEERRAWRLGRAHIAEELHADYDARAALMLAGYESGLL